LLGIPLGVPPLIHYASLGTVLGLLVVIWCLYHLIEYFGTISLWAIIGDLIPQESRSRFVGVREGMMIFGQTLGFFVCGWYTHYRIGSLPEGIPKWECYFQPTYWGITGLLVAVIPLLWITEIPWKKAESGLRPAMRQLLAPLRSRPFWMLVLFGVYLQMAGGLSQSVQHTYQMNVLHISLFFSLFAQNTTRIGQAVFAPVNGHWIERLGYFPVMCVSLMIVSCGSLCYFFADPSRWWWFYVAAIVWIFWVGVNVGIHSLVLSLSPPENKASGIAIYYTASTFSFAMFTLLGGFLADRFCDSVFVISDWGITWDYAHCSFLASFILRLSAIVLLFLIATRIRR